MKLLILAVGHKMPTWVGMAFEDYARRMPHDMPVRLIEMRPEPRGSGSSSRVQVDRLLKLEAQRLRAAIPAGAITVALDQRGQAVGTEAFARLIEGWRHEGADAAFLIGGADGLDAQLKRSARLMLSLSAMTLPHQLVRVILVEQLYRAVSLLHGHPYHRL
jgi:23S rRNA (pseudouridine1915-N3)-methyltransferase